MVMPKTDPRWKSLVEGKITHEFKSVSGSLMLSRITRGYIAEPTAANLENGIAEAISFFTKYETLFADDLKIIFK